MKLVIDVRMINASGIGRYLKNVLPGIVSEFSQVVVLGNKDEIVQFEWASKVEIVNFNAKIYSVKEQILYPFLIPRCDVFWSPHFNFPFLPFRAKKRVVTIHDVFHLSGKFPISLIIKKYAYLLYKNAVWKADLIFTVSEFSKAEIIKHTLANPNKIKVTHCGVDLSFFRAKNIEEKLQLPREYILYVGNVKPHKNLITLLKAYSILPQKFKSKCKLVIVGKKEGFMTRDNQLEYYIKKNDLEKNVVFTGHINDISLSQYYQNCTLFVFPSLYEGFGLPILEALAAKTTVLASNCASLPEIGGEAVYYFDPTNHIELAQKIERYVNSTNTNPEMSKKSEIQLKIFTWEKTIENHLEGFVSIK